MSMTSNPVTFARIICTTMSMGLDDRLRRLPKPGGKQVARARYYSGVVTSREQAVDMARTREP